jgi:glycerol-3-phosphate dehydrogenase
LQLAEQPRQIDVLVIGGGINGAGIARDLAGRGLGVMLVEKNDLASATSSASTKLIHGGLRYLEYYEFRLVREALKEREVLLRSAPHIIWPLSFVLPHHSKLRPAWLIRLGLFLYDHIGGRKMLPKSRKHKLTGKIIGAPLKPEFKTGFSYADCWVEDTRLVVLNAMDAAEKGAEVYTRTECVKIARHTKLDGWIVTLHDHITGEQTKIHALSIVNASGPWVNETLGLGKIDTKYHVRWVKGSHIIVPRLYQGDHAYILQNADKRIVFVIPYESKYSLIGTTDIDYTAGDIDEVRISFPEVEYLCNVVSSYFKQFITPDDVEWTYSGVRPLIDDGKGNAAAVTRDYTLEMHNDGNAPILNVYGGKITTFRRLSEQAGDKIVKALGRGGKKWTAKAQLPGAEGVANFKAFYKTVRREFDWMPESMTWRMAQAYGTRMRDVLRGAKRMSELGENLGNGVYEAEIRYLINVEWALSAEDILWRRSKLGLHIAPQTEQRIRKLVKKILDQQATTHDEKIHPGD